MLISMKIKILILLAIFALCLLVQDLFRTDLGVTGDSNQLNHTKVSFRKDEGLIKYEISGINYKEESVEVNYPSILGLDDEAMQETINKLLQKV